MNDIQFIGEHLLPGNIGQFSLVLAFCTALLSSMSYFFASQNPDSAWKIIGRWAFRIQSIGVLGIFSTLFYIIYTHKFEYHYAWAHSSTALPTHYIISCFWEGQEGSFLLWSFWQLVLGNIFILVNKNWEDRVMTIIGLSQVCILSMLLGVQLFGYQIGSSPFILLRDTLNAPIFSRPNYLEFIKDGNGLNPLLQNYWMVIHPPTLFLGFASTVVPFAFAIAGLWSKKYTEWVKPAIPWALFSLMILGTGIIMGAFWAYEALNFGGFWNWDPVENASLIPWLMLAAALHVLVAYRHTGHSYITATLLTISVFILVLYASFLTRSGILGESSVHAFTDLGMSGQLIFYIIIFLGISTYLLVSNWKSLPITQKDEATYSREFWLFVGALVLVLSCFQLLLTTSIPVYNAITGAKFAPPTNPVAHYNKWQLPFAILVTIISAFSQLLKYKNTNERNFLIQMGVAAGISLIFTALIAVIAKFTQLPFILLIFGSLFAIITNFRILRNAFTGNWKIAGSAVAHIGFAIMLVGAMVAASRNYVISVNNGEYDYGKDFNEKNTRENILLFKDEAVKMGEYTLTYLRDTLNGPDTYFKVNYLRKDKEGKTTENFDLYPRAQVNPKMGLIASPDTRHYLFHDIYTHVSSVPIKNEDRKEKYNTPVMHTLTLNDSIQVLKGINVKFLSINNKEDIKDLNIEPEKGDLAAEALLIVSGNGHTHEAKPAFVIKGNNAFSIDAKVEDMGLLFSFQKIDPATKTITIGVADKTADSKDYIIMKAIVFPYINLLWGGAIIMIIGFIISIVRRTKELA